MRLPAYTPRLRAIVWLPSAPTMIQESSSHPTLRDDDWAGLSATGVI
jgi:hypothetical protein